jgi:cytochrome c
LAIAGAAAAILAATSAFGQGDTQRGQQVFQDNCSGCHVLTGEGYAAPPLAGVYGRKAGAVPGFGYSDAMKKSGIVWDGASLGSFLADPSKAVPGTAMAVNVTDAQQRDDVIAYLKAQSPGAH